MTSADAADTNDAPDEPNTGEQMHASITAFIADIYDNDPCVVTRFAVIAECDDGETRWVDVAAFSADGHTLPQWESLGLIEYAKRVERGDFSHSHTDEDDEDDA